MIKRKWRRVQLHNWKHRKSIHLAGRWEPKHHLEQKNGRKVLLARWQRNWAANPRWDDSSPLFPMESIRLWKWDETDGKLGNSDCHTSTAHTVCERLNKETETERRALISKPGIWIPVMGAFLILAIVALCVTFKRRGLVLKSQNRNDIMIELDGEFVDVSN